MPLSLSVTISCNCARDTWLTKYTEEYQDWSGWVSLFDVGGGDLCIWVTSKAAEFMKMLSKFQLGATEEGVDASVCECFHDCCVRTRVCVLFLVVFLQCQKSG